jgi:hypothetical protein
MAGPVSLASRAVLPVLAQPFLHLRISEPHVPDDGVRQAKALVHFRQPFRLPHLVVVGALGLDVHRHLDVPALHLAAHVLRQVVLADERVVAEQEVRHDLVGQPGVVDAIEVPQVVMGIDDARRAHALLRKHYALPAKKRASWRLRSASSIEPASISRSASTIGAPASTDRTSLRLAAR